MAEIRETHTVFGPFHDYDPLDTARLFLRTNGYQIVEEETGAPPSELQVEPWNPPEEDPQEGSESDEEGEEAEVAESADSEASEPEQAEPPSEILTSLTVERGARGRGWFSSNLTELHTRVTLRLEGNKLHVEYVVDTTGQHLWEEEQGFWKKEARALEQYLVADGDLTNVAEGERERASEIRRDFVMMGFWIGGIVAIILFLVLVTLFRAV